MDEEPKKETQWVLSQKMSFLCADALVKQLIDWK